MASAHCETKESLVGAFPIRPIRPWRCFKESSKNPVNIRRRILRGSGNLVEIKGSSRIIRDAFNILATEKAGD